MASEQNRNDSNNQSNCADYGRQRMPRSSGRWKCSLLLAVIISFIAGCAGKYNLSPADAEEQAFEDLRSEIREVIDEPAREKEAIAMVDALVDDLDNLRQKISARRERVKQLNADYDTTRAEFEAFYDQVDSDIRSNKRRVSEKQRALFAAITSDERSAIAKTHTKALDAAIRHIETI